MDLLAERRWPELSNTRPAPRAGTSTPRRTARSGQAPPPRLALDGPTCRAQIARVEQHKTGAEGRYEYARGERPGPGRQPLRAELSMDLLAERRLPELSNHKTGAEGRYEYAQANGPSSTPNLRHDQGIVRSENRKSQRGQSHAKARVARGSRSATRKACSRSATRKACSRSATQKACSRSATRKACSRSATRKACSRSATRKACSRSATRKACSRSATRKACSRSATRKACSSAGWTNLPARKRVRKAQRARRP